MSLRNLVISSAQRWPDNLAIKSHDRSITYRELDSQANRLARMLDRLGVGPGDRVGIWLEKSIYTVVAMQAAFRMNAAYAPLAPLSPFSRHCANFTSCKQ